MNINCKTQYELTADELQQLAHYRHKVFIDTLGWQLPTSDGIELDQFDRHDTVYVTVKNAAGHTAAAPDCCPPPRRICSAKYFRNCSMVSLRPTHPTCGNSRASPP